MWDWVPVTPPNRELMARKGHRLAGKVSNPHLGRLATGDGWGDWWRPSFWACRGAALPHIPSQPG